MANQYQNFDIDFVSDPTPNANVGNPTLETIKIVHEENIDYSYLTYHSPYEEKGHHRQVRYSAERELNQCLDKHCTWALEVQTIVTFVWKIGSNIIKYKPQKQFTL